MSDRGSAVPSDVGPTRRQAIVGAAMAVGGLALVSPPVRGKTDDEISRANEAIHQVVTFNASPARVYETLTSAPQFDKVVKLSAAMKSGMSLGAAPTTISTQVGGAFVLFGGYVSGRHIELVPRQRLVQAWRAGSWKPGVFSIARFELSVAGSGTQLTFDHTGFPNGEAEHLAEGWHVNYWEPMMKAMALP